MKKNLFFALAIGTAFAVTSCEQNNASQEEAVVTEETSAPATPQIDNPNVVTTSANVTPSANAAVIEFKELEYDFGTIKQGQIVEHTFVFTNTGSSPLIIESASASCGCTAPDWTKTPVAPGSKGEIKVVFNSAGKSGQQSPNVTVRANTEPNITRISMKGSVEAGGIPTAGADGPVRRN